MCWETIQLPCQVAEGTLSVSNHLWRLWGGIQQLTPRLGIGHSEKQKQKPNFFCSSSDFSHCQVHYYRDKNSILQLDCPDYAMLECRWCMLWLSSGDVILQTLKWNQEVSNAPQYLHRKRKKSLPQYEAPLPRQIHQEVCKKGRSARLHDAGTHGQAHAHPLQFLQCLKNRNGHTNVFLHMWTVSLPALAQPGFLFSRYFYILQVWETGYPVLTDMLHQAPAAPLYRCHPLRRDKFTVTQMASRFVFATRILSDYPFGLWLTAPERGQMRMFVSKERSFAHSKVYRLKKKSIPKIHSICKEAPWANVTSPMQCTGHDTLSPHDHYLSYDIYLCLPLHSNTSSFTT